MNFLQKYLDCRMNSGTNNRSLRELELRRWANGEREGYETLLGGGNRLGSYAGEE
jgi:hypothetical protein